MRTIHLVQHPHSNTLKAVRVLLSPGEEVGEHVTENREEIIIVLKGGGLLIKEKEKLLINEGDIHYIKENTRHNIRNTSSKEMEYVYVVNSLQLPV